MVLSHRHYHHRRRQIDPPIGVELPLADTPPSVQSAIQSQIGQGAVNRIDKSFEDGIVSYEVHWRTMEGAKRSATVLDDGKVESRQVFLSEIPPAVQNTIQKHLGGGKIRSIDQVFKKKRGGSDFEVEAVKEGKSFFFTVGPKGAFLGMEN